MTQGAAGGICRSQPPTRAWWLPPCPHRMWGRPAFHSVTASATCVPAPLGGRCSSLPGRPWGVPRGRFRSRAIQVFPINIRHKLLGAASPSPVCDRVLALPLLYGRIGEILMCTPSCWLGSLWGHGANSLDSAPTGGAPHMEALSDCSCGPGPQFPRPQAPVSPLLSGQMPGRLGSSGEGKVEGR